MGTIFITVLHVTVCIALILIVLLQTGKGADMGAAFGGGSSQTVFGSTGPANFLSKGTTAAAVIFMLTSLLLAIPSGSAVERVKIADDPVTQEQVDQAALPVAVDAVEIPAETTTPAAEATATEAVPAPAPAEATDAPAPEAKE